MLETSYAKAGEKYSSINEIKKSSAGESYNFDTRIARDFYLKNVSKERQLRIFQ